MDTKKHGPVALLCVRAISAAIIIAFALGYQIPMQTLQLAELLTICINTALLLLSVSMLAVVVFHVLMSTGLAREPRPRSPLRKAAFGMVFSLELAAFALIGWWFTLALRVTSFVIVKTAPYEKEAA